jgi:ethanolaminephosphotransferase
LLAQTSFFALGLNNSISSVDLSNAYNGVSGYNVLAVGLLVFLSNWAGPVYWSVAGVLLLGGTGEAKRSKATKGQQGRSWVQEEHALLATLAGPKAGDGERKSGQGVWASHVSLLTLFTGVMLVSVMAACTALRTHLFIWTVFSPKYLFAMAWGVAWHLGVTIGLGSLVSWLGGW